MVLIPFLFPGSIPGVTKHRKAKSARKERESEEQEYERWHNAFPFCRIPDIPEITLPVGKL
jgi:hypothetical protein